MFAKSVIILLSAFSCVQVLATPHAVRDAHHHRALAARMPHPEPEPEPLLPLLQPKKRDIRKRALRKRCAARSVSGSPSSTVAASSSISVPENVESTLSSSSSSSSFVAPSSSSVFIPSSSSVFTPSSSSVFIPSSSSIPTSTPPPTSTSTSTEAPATSSASSSSSDSGVPDGYYAGTNSGQATFYTPGVGACGDTSTVSSPICAVSEALFDSYPGYNGANPNDNPVCGKQIEISYGGASVTVTVVDRCTGCAPTDLDLAPDMFTQLAAASVGRIDMTWTWV